MSQRHMLSWLQNPTDSRGIRFLRADGTWEFRPYAELAALTRRVAAGLAGAGVAPGSVVAIVQRSSPTFVATLFGAMAAGCVPSPIAPPLAFQKPDVYAEHVTSLFRTAQPRAVLADPDLVDTLLPLAAAAELAGLPDGPAVRTVEAVLAAAGPDADTAERADDDLALLQFTSGSSGTARGVRIPYSALAANVEAIRAWLRMTPEDPTASWLPVHHDMGLIGCLVTPVVNRSDIWLMQPEQFVQRPLTYLECFGRHGARLTAMPNFGLGYLARRVKPAQTEGMDLSRWRTVIVGAERLDPDAFEAFHTLLAPRGLNRLAVLPAYGLAESTLAVTGLPLDEPWTGLDVDPASLVLGGKVDFAPVTGGRELIGCGRPLGTAEVFIFDEDGVQVPDRVVGEIVVRGPSVAAGYVAAVKGPSSLADGLLSTGDAGFLHEGQLYVLGRLGDSMKVRGRTLFAEDLEAALGAAGVPASRVAVLLGERRGRPTAVAVLEHPQPEWLAGAAKVLAARGEGVDVVLVDTPRGSITRTSSGKPRRRPMWRAYVADRLPGRIVDAVDAAAGTHRDQAMQPEPNGGKR